MENLASKRNSIWNKSQPIFTFRKIIVKCLCSRVRSSDSVLNFQLGDLLFPLIMAQSLIKNKIKLIAFLIKISSMSCMTTFLALTSSCSTTSVLTTTSWRTQCWSWSMLKRTHSLRERSATSRISMSRESNSARDSDSNSPSDRRCNYSKKIGENFCRTNIQNWWLTRWKKKRKKAPKTSIAMTNISMKRTNQGEIVKFSMKELWRRHLLFYRSKNYWKILN